MEKIKVDSTRQTIIEDWNLDIFNKLLAQVTQQKNFSPKNC